MFMLTLTFSRAPSDRFHTTTKGTGGDRTTALDAANHLSSSSHILISWKTFSEQRLRDEVAPIKQKQYVFYLGTLTNVKLSAHSCFRANYTQCVWWLSLHRSLNRCAHIVALMGHTRKQMWADNTHTHTDINTHSHKESIMGPRQSVLFPL